MDTKTIIKLIEPYKREVIINYLWGDRKTKNDKTIARNKMKCRLKGETAFTGEEILKLIEFLKNQRDLITNSII